MAISYHFYLRKDKQKDNGKSPVYLRITQNRKSRYITTGIVLKPKYWNDNTEKVRRSHRRYKSLNSILEKKLDDARQVEDDLAKYGKDSAKAIQARLKKQESGDFFDLAETYLKEVKADKSFYTYKNAKVAISKMEAFEGERSLPLNHIDTDYLERFERYLKNEWDNKPNTINKNFITIKSIFKKALKSHLISIDPFVNFEGAKRSKSGHKTKLSIHQIHAIEDLDLQKGSNLWHTRNYFMFSFFSGGIRFGDLCCLKWKDIDSERQRLSYQMNKNQKIFTIELNNNQIQILDHYAVNRQPNGFVFPILNNHKDYSDPVYLRKRISSKNVVVNKRLKQMATKVNEKLKKSGSNIPIIENLSFHVARHSFAQQAIENGLNMYELRQALRHSDIVTTQKYLKGLDEQLADKAMKKAFDGWE